MAEIKRITLHPLKKDGTIDTDVNLYPKTLIDGIVDRDGNEFEVQEKLVSGENIKTIVCVTGQHRQMLDMVLDTFKVKPDYDLSIMKSEQTLFDITTNILNRFSEVLDEVKPNVVLVHGDTSTTFVAALACFYKQIAVGHVEAGLRTYNIYSPYPEEFNRQAVSIISKYNFVTPSSSLYFIKFPIPFSISGPIIASTVERTANISPIIIGSE